MTTARVALGLTLFLLPAATSAADRSAALVDTFSVPELARAARAVEPGGTLRLERLVLDGATETLELERFAVFTPDAEILVHGEDGATERLPVPDNAHFRGGVVGAPGSLAILSVRESGEVRGLVRLDGRVHVLGAGAPPSPGGAPGLTARRARAPAGEAEGFTCAADGLPTASGTTLAAHPLSLDGSPTLAGKALAPSYTARVAVETDWELFQLLGSETAVTDYVGDLIGYASGIYDQEVTTDLQISHLSIRDHSGDPWTQGDAVCALFEFGRWWNDNRSGVERTLAHFVSGKFSNVGIAWLGVLCDGPFPVDHEGSCPGLTPNVDDYGGAYSLTMGVDGDFDPQNPSPVWDIVAVAHEIGHNFDSKHTHCYEGIGGSSEPVDECYNGQSDQTGCHSGTESLPCPSGESGCGTLMSYCHFRPGGLSNIALTLGADHPWGVLPGRVPDRMLAHVEAVASGSSCLDRVGGGCGEELVLSDETVSTTETYESCGTLRAGNGFQIVDPGIVTFRGSRVVLEDGFSVGSGASFAVEIQ